MEQITKQIKKRGTRDIGCRSKSAIHSAIIQSESDNSRTKVMNLERQEHSFSATLLSSYISASWPFCVSQFIIPISFPLLVCRGYSMVRCFILGE